jgi:hypothetical protein
MPGRLADVSSSTNATLPTADGACFVWVTNTGASAITVSPSAGTTFVAPWGSAYSLPAGKCAQFTYAPGGYFWMIRQSV